MKRKTGYYWIKRHDKSDWEPALYMLGHLGWEVIGVTGLSIDEEIHAVRKNEFGIEQPFKIPE